MIKRLPAEKQTRLSYAWAAFLGTYASGLIVAIAFGVLTIPTSEQPHVVSAFRAVPGMLILGLFYSAVVTICALICWPSKTRRTRLRMGLAGILTVFCVFVFMGMASALIAFSNAPRVDRLDDAAEVFAFFIASASVMTLGIPYGIAVLLSQLFVEDTAG